MPIGRSISPELSSVSNWSPATPVDEGSVVCRVLAVWRIFGGDGGKVDCGDGDSLQGFALSGVGLAVRFCPFESVDAPTSPWLSLPSPETTSAADRSASWIGSEEVKRID